MNRDLLMVDVINEAFKEMNDIDFEGWLESEAKNYIMNNKDGYISLDAFLLQYNALELPLEEHYETRAVLLIKKWENERLRSIASNNPNTAKLLLEENKIVDTKMKIDISFASGIGGNDED